MKLEHECLCDVKTRAYKGRNAREDALRAFRNYLKLFRITLHILDFTQTVFRNVYLLNRIIQIVQCKSSLDFKTE